MQTFNFGTPLWTHTQQRAISGKDASFFERASREHLRDWPALRTLQTVLRDINPSTQQPLTILSKQMGMVNYHLLQEFHQKIHVWDMAALVDNTLRDCPVMAQDGFDRQGLRINYRKFFERLPQAQKDCGIQAPDIIYDIYGWGETTPLPDYLRTQGYTIIFNQTGRVDMQLGIDITAQEMIAVHTQFLVARAITVPETFVDFNALLKQQQ